MKSWLQNNNIEIYSTHSEGESVAAERLIPTLDYIVNKYNNKYHRIIKMDPVDVKPSMYIDFNKENNKEGPKCKVGDHVRISNIKIRLCSKFV